LLFANLWGWHTAFFGIGVMCVAVGVLGMVPRWWRHRQAARQAIQAAETTPTAEARDGA
jgi:predicted MFS family arabinose efflux permease